MIVIIDYKMGNTGSILNMLKKIGETAVISSDIKDINNADKLILPGVGSFDTGMNNINNSGLLDILNKKVLKEKTPILGICLGMQLFANKSEEGIKRGLGWIGGNVVKFKFKDNNLKIPHMGWNEIKIKKNDVLFKNIAEEPRFYFVHSYYFFCNDNNDVLATTNYGYDFASVVRKDNIRGVQFHPEKSHKYGMNLLKNFAQLC
ncbi:imidazole glycerol phosphate synthase subunit HisH [Patescibacteria group bacterium]|nr:imidazole glycerol phosphate synthase subunit HisH [Patescibacteria group bacterium]